MLGCFSNLLEKVLLSLIFAVNSICLWTCLLFFILAIISDCGCKSRTSFLICQTFWNFFLKKFSLRLNQYFKWTSLCLRVAKVEPLFKSRKLFLKFFSIYFRSQFRFAYQYFKWTFPYFTSLNFDCFQGVQWSAFRLICGLQR